VEAAQDSEDRPRTSGDEAPNEDTNGEEGAPDEEHGDEVALQDEASSPQNEDGPEDATPGVPKISISQAEGISLESGEATTPRDQGTPLDATFATHESTGETPIGVFMDKSYMEPASPLPGPVRLSLSSVSPIIFHLARTVFYS
jgi:hypothetical protein